MLDEFDQDFLVVTRSHQEKIYAGTIRSRARCWIDRLELESGAQDFRGAVHIRNVEFYLLNSFPEFFKETRNCAVAARRFRRQDIQVDVRHAALCKFELEFQHVLVGGRFGEWWRAVGGANLIERLRQDGESDS